MDEDLTRLEEWESVLSDLDTVQKRFEEFEDWLRLASDFYPPFLRTVERMKQVRRSFDEKADEIRWWMKQVAESSEGEEQDAESSEVLKQVAESSEVLKKQRPRLPSPHAKPKKMPRTFKEVIADLS